MSTINQSSQSCFARIYNVSGRVMDYVTRVDVYKPFKISVDTVAPKISNIKTIRDDKIKQGHFGVLYDGTRSFYFIVTSVKTSKNEKSMDLNIKVNLDMLSIKTFAPNYGTVGWKEGVFNIGNLTTLFNADIDFLTSPTVFAKMPAPYIFTGGTSSINTYFGNTRTKTHGDIIRDAMRSDGVYAKFELKKNKSFDSFENASAYYIDVNLQMRDTSKVALSLYDTNIFLDYNINSSNMEYNALQLGVVGSEWHLFYLSVDGDVIEQNFPTPQPDWLDYAITPLAPERKIVEISSGGASAYDQALFDLSQQYWSNQITATVNLKTVKFDFSNLDNVFNAGISIYLGGVEVNTSITAYEYTGGDTMEVTFGNTRVNLTDKIKMKGLI